MEAAPRLPMLSLELKVPQEAASFKTKLKQYIADCYREDPESYNNEIHQLEGLRAAAVRPAIDMTGTSTLKRYFCQLRGLQSRFPMSKGQPAAIAFAWKDLFANIVCTLSDIRFELVCVLYNIGALHSKLGAAEARQTPDSMKSACTHFQTAVWAFQHLKDHYPQPSGVDLSPDIMKLFQDICLAQAQECILEKSMQDNRKPAIVGAIGMQAIQHYKSALTALESPPSADHLHETVGVKTCNAWHKSLSFKVAYISSVVYLFQGMQSEELQRMGERVAYYQLASEKLQEARKLSKGLVQGESINEALTFTNDVVEGKRKAAKNENEFIYHEEVPDKELLSEPKPAALAKGITINFNDPEISGPDIFGRLVPMRAHEASSMYSEEKAKLLRKVCGEVELKDTQLNEFMSSLQLDELNILNEPERLPQELIDICASLSVKTDAIQNLIETMNSLADIHTEVESMFSDIKHMIEVEESSEKEFQQIIGKRPPSIISTELSREANKYLEAHNKANESNQTLHKAMTLHLANLKILCLPLEDLSKHIPSLETVKGNIDSSAMTEMRSLVEKVNEMRAQRSMLILQLREAVNSDDITSQLLTRTGESLDEIFKQEIEKHSKVINLINQNMLAQENILKALTEAYAKYAPSRKIISDILKKKESFFIAMRTSYETYEDLLKKSLKGIEFYRKLSSTVARLLSRLKSICNVQQEERAQLLSSHSSKIIKNPTISSTDNFSTNTVVKEEISTGPKLKDFLPYMKNRNNPQNPQTSDSADASFAGHMYPPYVRPAPLGSEGKNEPTVSNYPDTSYNMKVQNMSDGDMYNPYVPSYNPTVYPTHSEQNTINYNFEQYPAVDSRNYANAPYSTYYGQNTNFVENNPKSLNVNENMPNQNVNFKESETGFSNYQGTVSSLSHYNQNIPTSQNMGSVPNHDIYNQGYNMMTTNFQQGTMGMNVAQNQMHYPNVSHATYPDTSQTDYNKLVNQMQNVDISNQLQNQTPTNMYGNNLSTLGNANMYDMPLQYQENIPTSTNILYSNVINQQGDNTLTSQANYNFNNPSSDATSDTMLSKTNYSNYHIDPNQINNFQSPNQINSFQPPNQANNFQPSNQINNFQPPNQVNNFQPSISPNVNNQNIVQNPYVYQQIPTDSNITTPQDFNKIAPESSISSHMGNYTQISHSSLHPEATTVNQNSPNTCDELQNTNYTSQASLDALPIQSHVQREFLPKNIPHSLSCNVNSFNQPAESISDFSNSTNEVNQQYIGYNADELGNNNSYQNHPGYSYNDKTGIYDYNYGYQNCSNNEVQQVISSNNGSQENQYQQNLYTSAGTYGTMQTSSKETGQTPVSDVTDSTQYYSLPYGYQSANLNDNSQTIQENNEQTISVEQPNVNNQNSLTYINARDTTTTTTYSDQGKTSIKSTQEDATCTEVKTKELSSIDLLSGLDFSIEQTPLMPEIRVPPVSERVIRKVPLRETPEVTDCESICEDEIIERPLKKDIFADPILLNKFTQEVKSLQQFVDGFTKKTHSGITMLDSKWKKIQDTQNKENHLKTTNDAKSNLLNNVSPDVIPYDDSRVKLTSEFSNYYINASHVKQISSWCIPLVVSDLPSEENSPIFWHMIFQQKISVIVCLLTEIELQGKFYGPSSKNQKLEFDGLVITLNDIACNVNWTERKMTIKYKDVDHNITHYQINVFPARVVSAPLVMLVDRVLSTINANAQDNILPKTLIHCNTGAGRSSLIVFLTMVMCQVRAGYVDLRDMLDTGFLYLSSVRTNVLEDTKYLVDIYRTVLFYVQGVLCSGTVLFNGEAVAIQSGASVPPPHIVPHTRKSENVNKFSKESFEEMKQAAGLKSGDMQDPLSYLDPLWSLKKRKD